MFKMYTGIRDDEYNLMDSLCEEQYLIGGVTAWIYAYLGPKGNKGSTDATLPDYDTLGSTASDIGNLIFMESPNRKYSIDAISLPVVYQVKDANMDMQIPGLFLFDTQDITVPYNLMIKSLGRKVMSGDVIELANLRDTDLLDDPRGVNRFYVVQDAFKAQEGYSHTWYSHIWKMRVIPLTDSPEFKDILGSSTDEDSLSSYISTQQKELKIMDLIVQQADSEVPYIHWDNEQIYDPLLVPSITDIATSYEYPASATEGEYFIKKTKPVLYEYNNTWAIIDLEIYNNQTLPNTASDGDLCWCAGFNQNEDYTLLQFSKSWESVTVENGYTLPIASSKSGYFILYTENSNVLQYTNGIWIEVQNNHPPYLVTNKRNIQDMREELPNINTVQKGSQFPQNPVENTWFMRTDMTPPILWKFENSKWRKFSYGGRQPWTGSDVYRTSFVNNTDTYTDGSGNVHSSRQNSNNTLKATGLLGSE